MRKAILGLLAVVVFALAAWSQEVEPRSILMRRAEAPAKLAPAANAPSTLTVPAETEVAVQMLSGIHTRVSRVNDLVTARLLQPVYVNGRVALPSGSLLDGRITMIHPSRRLHRPGELGLRFEKIIMPDGQAKSIGAVLAALESPEQLRLRIDAEGHLSASRGVSLKSLFAGIAGLGAFGGVKAAAAGGATLSKVLPLGSAGWLGYEILWPRGRDVNLPPETICRLRLNGPLTVRVVW
jgi:hypothetical protein